MTDTEKLDDIRKKLRKMEIESKIQVVVVILTFVGIISLPSLINKIKKSLWVTLTSNLKRILKL